MSKMLLITLLFPGLFVLLCGGTGLPQSDTPRLEIGSQFSVLKLDYQFRGLERSIETADDYWLGLGGRVTYNLNENVAVEALIQKFHTDVSRPLSFSTAAQPDVQGLFGLKAGLRRGKLGFFGEVRPGFTRFTPVLNCPAISFISCSEVRDMGFSLDFGGVIETYVSRRFMLRGDIGAVYLRHRETTLFFPGEPGIPAFQFTSQGFKKVAPAFSAGFGFRF